MVTYLKTGIAVEQSVAADREVGRVVEGILREIENGIAAWRPLRHLEVERFPARVVGQSDFDGDLK